MQKLYAIIVLDVILKEENMSHEENKLDLQHDLQEIKRDVAKLRSDFAELIWQSTIGGAQRKIEKKPFYYLVGAFAAGFICSGLKRLWLRNK